jgi:hypothetical protein
VILHRCFAWSSRAAPTEPQGALRIPREWQGDGRHDNPAVYGCLYLADCELSAIVEQLAPFRTQRLLPSLLRRYRMPLALASFELRTASTLIDLDDPHVLVRAALRPSAVATRQHGVTQPQALKLHRTHPRAPGLRWWSTFEASWANVTLFDRAIAELQVRDVRELTVSDRAVVEAADYLGLGR